MRKHICIIMVIFLIVSVIPLTSCNDNSLPQYEDSTYNYQTDMQFVYYDIGSSKMNCTESEKGYYYIGSHGLAIFIDKLSMEAIPLCNKANCTHNDSDICDAYGYGGIQYNSGHLYSITKKYDSEKMADISFIMEISEDGTQKRIISNGFNETLLDWFVHRGYIYFVTNDTYGRLPLDNAKSEPQVIEDISAYDSPQINKFVAYGNYVYLTVNSSSWIFDTQKNTNITMPNIGSIVTFVNDKMISYKSAKNDNGGNNIVYYSSDLNGENTEKYCEYPAGHYLYSDSKYIYVDNGSYLNFFASEETFQQPDIFGQTLTVYDLDFNELDSFVIPFNQWINIRAQGTSAFIIPYYSETGQGELFSIDKGKIGEYKGAVADKKYLCETNWRTSTNNNGIVKN